MEVSNTIYYSQEDPRWAGVMYSNHGDVTQTIGSSGCGPTAMAMVVSSLTGKEVTPPILCKFAVKNGYRTYDKGTDPAFFEAVANKYGLNCKFIEKSNNLDPIKNSLNNGKIIITAVGKGHFTNNSHYIVIYGWEVDRAGEEWFLVMDPNYNNRCYGNDGKVEQGIKNDGMVKAMTEIFKNEAQWYWVFGK